MTILSAVLFLISESTADTRNPPASDVRSMRKNCPALSPPKVERRATSSQKNIESGKYSISGTEFSHGCSLLRDKGFVRLLLFIFVPFR